VAFKQCSVGSKWPKVCQEAIPHTITPPSSAWTVDTRQDGSMLLCCLPQILTLPSLRLFFCPIFVSPCELYPQFPIFSWQEWHSVWSSAAVAHLLQGSMCCVGYLSYCCLSISSYKSGHSTLTSGIIKAFSPTELTLTGYFLFFGKSQ